MDEKTHVAFDLCDFFISTLQIQHGAFGLLQFLGP
jgi:hypothetical protein